jgi:hypothetical protein
MVAVAASGWTALKHRARWLRMGGVVLLIAGLLNIMSFNVRSYPNQAVYFNELAGGPKGAFGKYDLDYWGNCLLQAVEWSADVARQAQMPVRVYGRPEHLVQNNIRRFYSLALAPSKDDPHHLEVRLLRGSVEDLWLNATHPDLVHRVTTADGAVLCVVLRGPDFDDLRRRLETFGRWPPS